MVFVLQYLSCVFSWHQQLLLSSSKNNVKHHWSLYYTTLCSGELKHSVPFSPCSNDTIVNPLFHNFACKRENWWPYLTYRASNRCVLEIDNFPLRYWGLQFTSQLGDAQWFCIWWYAWSSSISMKVKGSINETILFTGESWNYFLGGVLPLPIDSTFPTTLGEVTPFSVVPL